MKTIEVQIDGNSFPPAIRFVITGGNGPVCREVAATFQELLHGRTVKEKLLPEYWVKQTAVKNVVGVRR